VRSGDELLEIEPAAVSAFIDAVERRFEVELPGSMSEPVDTDPWAVAELVQSCREAIREVLFGPGDRKEAGRARGSVRRDGSRRLVARPEGSATNWRQARGGVIVLAPTVRQPAIVGFEVPEERQTGELEFTAQVHSSDAPPLVLRLSIARNGEEGQVLDEISVAGPADREWRVVVPTGTEAQDLRLSCALAPGGSRARRARVRVARPALGPAPRT
jgi:hypothetical protein